MEKRCELTQRLVDNAECSPDQDEAIWHDTRQPGLKLRVRGGSKSYTMRYRVGRGRGARQRRLVLNARKILLEEARRLVAKRCGEIADHRDPVGERKQAQKRERRRLGTALDDYEADLTRREVVKRGEVISLLRRELEDKLGANTDLADIDREVLVKRVSEIEASGRPGAARELKVRAAVFLGWAANAGKITLSPAAGWRRERATRAERLDLVGRALADSELRAFWKAAVTAVPWPFDGYLKVLLLCGQRRSETAAMTWSQINEKAGTWTIPAAISKSGREHVVPLPPVVMKIIRKAGRTTSPLVFPGRGGVIMSGWDKRLEPVRAASKLAHWTLHDLRRTFRTGLSTLGVEYEIRELMLNHARRDLEQRYDRAELWSKRVEAAESWAAHVLKAIKQRKQR
jgi:integrase